MRLRGAPRATNDPALPLWKRVTPSTLVSVVLHIGLGVVAWHAIQVPAFFDRILFSRPSTPPVERIEYVALAPSADTGSGPRQARAPARTVPDVAPLRPAEPLVAPTTVPTELPPVRLEPSAPVTGAPSSGAATGALRGGSGATRGIQPAFDDPRVWAPIPEFVYAPKTEKERLDSAVVSMILQYADSMAATTYQPNKFERGDWTFERNGQKFGIDRQFIRLGPISIPTALLALLPLNQMQPNPIEMDRARLNGFMRADILYHAQAAMNEEQFRAAVRAIRDRKERERRNAERDGSRSLGPITSPGERPPQP